MPMYEYECGNCGKFESIRRIEDADNVHCPACTGKAKRLPSRFNFSFGWTREVYPGSQNKPLVKNI